MENGRGMNVVVVIGGFKRKANFVKFFCMAAMAFAASAVSADSLRPMLWADVPDISICCKGSKYYMVLTSTRRKRRAVSPISTILGWNEGQGNERTGDGSAAKPWRTLAAFRGLATLRCRR